MNLPEGWPTEEMLTEGYIAYLVVSEQPKLAIGNAFNAMIAVAPTLPSVIEQCVEPYKSHQCLDCGKVIEPTPPAQEDEPVSWKVCDFCDDSIPVYTRPDDKLRKAAESLVALSDRWGTQMPYGIKVGIEDLRAELEGK